MFEHSYHVTNTCMLHNCDNQTAQEDDSVELRYIDDANRLTVLCLTLVFDLDYSSLCLNDTILHTHTRACRRHSVTRKRRKMTDSNSVI